MSAPAPCACCLGCRRLVTARALTAPSLVLPPPDWCGPCGRAVSEVARGIEAQVAAKLDAFMGYAEDR